MMRAIVAMAFLVTASAARADQVQTVTFEPAVVASGTAVTYPAGTGVIQTASFRSMNCQFRTSNEGGGASRLYIPKCYNRSGTTVMYTYPTITVETNKTEQLNWDPGASAATAATDTTVWPHNLCPYIKITAAAANGITQVSCTLKN